jgi:tetratricopeptide (TPR) repeat protein
LKRPAALSWKEWRRRLQAAAAAAAWLGLAVVAWKFWRYSEQWTVRALDLVASDVEMGEQLLHGLRLPGSQGISGTMPLLTAWMAMAGWHVPEWVTRASWLVIGLWRLALSFSLGWLVGGPPGALLSAVGAGYLLRGATSGSYMQAVFSALVLTAAGALVLRAKRPTPARSALAGAAVGVSLLYRSPLAFLPPLVALADWLWAPRGRKPGWKLLAPLVVTPYLFLLPWVACNYASLHQLVPFEYKRADMNIVLGAMGLVPNADGDWKILVKDPPDADKSGAVLRWAAREVARHPARYARAVVARVVYVARTIPAGPALMLGALAAAVLLPRRPGQRVLALTTLYFLLIHCLLTVARDYLTPFWALAAAVCAGGLAAPLSPAEPQTGAGAGERAAEGVVWGGLAAALLACLPVLWLVSRWNARAAARPEEWPEALSQALAESPRDAWLLEKLGHERLAEGKAGEAVPLFARAAAERPEDPRPRLSLAWSSALAGDPKALFEARPEPGMDQVDQLNLYFMQSHAYARARDERMARETARQGLRDWLKSCLVVNRMETGIEKEVLEGMRPSPPITALLRRTLDELPEDQRAALLRRITALERPDFVVDAYLELAQLAAARGDDAALKRELAPLAGARMMPAEMKMRQSLLARGAAKTEVERQALRAAARRRPVDSASSVAAALSKGDGPKALALLQRAQANARTDGERLSLLRLRDRVDAKVQGAAALAAALDALAAQVVASSPKDPAAWIEKAACDRASGRRDAALAALAKARDLRPKPEQQERMAGIYQDLKAYDRAQAVWRGLLRRSPGRADGWHNLGVAEFLAGKPAQAAADVEKAVSLSPSEASYALTLGTIYRSQRRSQDEVSVYDAALRRAAPEDPLRPMLLKARAEAAGEGK